MFGKMGKGKLGPVTASYCSILLTTSTEFQSINVSSVVLAMTTSFDKSALSLIQIAPT